MDSNEVRLLRKNIFAEKQEDPEQNPCIFFQKYYEYDETVSANALHPVAGGESSFLTSCKVSFSPMPFLLLLYCPEGSLSIETPENSLTVPAGHFIAFPADARFFMHITAVPCCLRCWLIGGDTSVFRIDPENTVPVYPSLHIRSVLTLDSLSGFPEYLSRYQALDLHLLLTDILTSYCKMLTPAAEKKQPHPSPLPGYLEAMHHAIKMHSENPYTLQHFEDRFGVSRYRLCREYRSAFGISPISDLSRTRIENARKLLQETALSVQEIGMRTGFFDTNNFIRIFKKNTGQTPGQFRHYMFSFTQPSFTDASRNFPPQSYREPSESETPRSIP